MTIGSLLIGLAMLIIMGLILARPLMTPLPSSRQPSMRHQKLVQKELILDQISALDFDFDTGKIPEEVYQTQREQMLQKAESIFKELDDLKPKRRVKPASGSPAVVRDVDAEIEAAISRQRQQPETAVAQPAPENQPANRQKGHFCAQCGAQADDEDKFCVNCGHRLLAHQLA